MMLIHRLASLLNIAEQRRADGINNSDEWVVRKLREERAERADLLSKIEDDASVADQAMALRKDIVLIDGALTAYPELMGAKQEVTAWPHMPVNA